MARSAHAHNRFRFAARNLLLPCAVAMLCVAVVRPAAGQTPDELQRRREAIEKQLREQPGGENLSAEQLKQKVDDALKQIQDRANRSRNRRSSRFQVRSPEILAAFTPVVSKVVSSTARVQVDGKDVALAAVVGADGWILTKRSEITDPEKIVCVLRGDKKLPAKLVGVAADLDLAMLKVDAKDLQPIDFAGENSYQVGDWVATSGIDDRPVSVGVVSVGPRAIPQLPGVLGVGLDESDQGPKINSIAPDSGAAKAGLQVGDVVLAVNGAMVKDRQDLVTRVRKFKPGDTLEFEMLRGDKKMSVKATLGANLGNARTAAQQTTGGPLSRRSTGFAKALQHDTVLRPSDCGGPLVDLQGKAIGINIARAGRTKSYALTADVVQSVLDDLKSGRLAPGATRPAEPTLAERLAAAEKGLDTALAILRQADEQSEQARRDLTKALADAQKRLDQAAATRAQAAQAVKEAKAALEKLRAEVAKTNSPEK